MSTISGSSRSGGRRILGSLFHRPASPAALASWSQQLRPGPQRRTQLQQQELLLLCKLTMLQGAGQQQQQQRGSTRMRRAQLRQMLKMMTLVMGAFMQTQQGCP